MFIPKITSRTKKPYNDPVASPKRNRCMPMHNVNNRSTDDHDLSDLAWSPSVGMGLQQGPFDWVPQQGRAEVDPYNSSKKHPEAHNVDCICVPMFLCSFMLCYCVSCVSVICDLCYVLWKPRK